MFLIKCEPSRIRPHEKREHGAGSWGFPTQFQSPPSAHMSQDGDSSSDICGSRYNSEDEAETGGGSAPLRSDGVIFEPQEVIGPYVFATVGAYAYSPLNGYS